MRDTCKHGYGGFFSCPQGCHRREDPVREYEDTDRAITYFLKRKDKLDGQTM
jgi:hypothetical protein